MVARFLIVFGVIGIAQASADAGACTVFALGDSARVIVGKNLDWEVEAGDLLINPRGRTKLSRAGDFEWAARYGSVSFNQGGRDQPLGGMNEAGLVVEEASYWPSKYPDAEGRPAINEFEWVQTQLDRFATVDEVLAGLVDLVIEPTLGGLHYFVADRSGAVAIIEFLDGETVVQRPDVPVLTNDTWERSRRYLGQHAGFGGTRVAGPGPESPERFVRAATLMQTVGTTVEDANRVLDDVAQDDTVWSIVYDPVELAVYYRTASAPAPKFLSLRPGDFSIASAVALTADLAGDVRPALKPATGATVTLVANAGVSIEIGGRIVLIDALFDLNGRPGAPPSRYAHLDRDQLDRLERGEDPYACADIVLATHGHDDHATRPSLVRHLESCSSAELYLPELAWPEGDPGWPPQRVHQVSVPRGASMLVREGTVRLEALGFRHGSRAGNEPAHVGWLVESDGLRILHVGDAAPMPDNLHDFDGALAAPVDLAIVPHWFVTHDGGWAWLVEELRPRQIAVVHVVTLDPRVMDALAAAVSEHPELIVLSEPLEVLKLAPLSPR